MSRTFLLSLVMVLPQLTVSKLSSAPHLTASVCAALLAATGGGGRNVSLGVDPLIEVLRNVGLKTGGSVDPISAGSGIREARPVFADDRLRLSARHRRRMEGALHSLVGQTDWAQSVRPGTHMGVFRLDETAAIFNLLAEVERFAAEADSVLAARVESERPFYSALNVGLTAVTAVTAATTLYQLSQVSPERVPTILLGTAASVLLADLWAFYVGSEAPVVRDWLEWRYGGFRDPYFNLFAARVRTATSNGEPAWAFYQGPWRTMNPDYVAHLLNLQKTQAELDAGAAFEDSLRDRHSMGLWPLLRHLTGAELPPVGTLRIQISALYLRAPGRAEPTLVIYVYTEPAEGPKPVPVPRLQPESVPYAGIGPNLTTFEAAGEP